MYFDNNSPEIFSSIFRMIVCNQVMKFILDKIEKDEKQAAKKRKKEEVVEQKRSRQNATKLTALLYKHKEQLKAEILKKRALLDKELQLQVQVGTQPLFTMMDSIQYILGLSYIMQDMVQLCVVFFTGGAEA